MKALSVCTNNRGHGVRQLSFHAGAVAGNCGDVAVQATVLRLSDADETRAGIGGRLTFDLSPWAAIDAEVSFYPKDDFKLGAVVYRRHRTVGFLGIKAGLRGDRVGLFAKVQPGFTRLVHKGLICRGDVCALILPFPRTIGPSSRSTSAASSSSIPLPGSLRESMSAM